MQQEWSIYYILKIFFGVLRYHGNIWPRTRENLGFWDVWGARPPCMYVAMGKWVRRRLTDFTSDFRGTGDHPRCLSSNLIVSVITVWISVVITIQILERQDTQPVSGYARIRSIMWPRFFYNPAKGACLFSFQPNIPSFIDAYNFRLTRKCLLVLAINPGERWAMPGPLLFG